VIWNKRFRMVSRLVCRSVRFLLWVPPTRPNGTGSNGGLWGGKVGYLGAYWGMQVQCPKCAVSAAIGTTKWFFDGGECIELSGTRAGDAKDYQQCQTLAEAIAKAEKNSVTKPVQKPQPPR
jgi:hypothetical protein